MPVFQLQNNVSSTPRLSIVDSSLRIGFGCKQIPIVCRNVTIDNGDNEKSNVVQLFRPYRLQKLRIDEVICQGTGSTETSQAS